MQRRAVFTAVLIFISAALLSCAPRTTLKESDLRALAGSGVPAVSDTARRFPDVLNKPYIPVVLPPRVLKVWLYTHEAPTKDLVMGTIVFVCLDPPCRWYTDRYRETVEKRQLPHIFKQKQQRQVR